jgi:fibro-slime domain-containing protein
MMGKGMRMKNNNFKAKCRPVKARSSLKKQEGVVLLVTLLLMMGIAILGVGVVLNANLNSSIAKNYVGKLQSFYAADAQVALISQEVFDGNAGKYLSCAATGCSGSGNIIQNCDFGSGTSYWSTSTDEGATGTGSVSGGIYNIHITNGGITDHTWDFEAGQTGLTLTQGVTYTLRFDAKCNANRVMNVAVEDVSKWTAYSGYVDFYMTTAMQTYTMDFVMKDPTVTNAGIWFQGGGQGALDLWVDNVYLAPVSTTSTNLAKNKTTYCSSIEGSGKESSKAVDADALTTRWASSWADNQWITVDLGQSCLVTEVVLKWEAAFATNYEILLSTDNSVWYQAYQNTDGHGGNEVITFSPQVVRYVRMNGIDRTFIAGVKYGFSLYEFEVYGSIGGRSCSGKTTIGEDSVAWSLTEVIPSAGFSIADTSFKMFGVNKKTFTSQLAQYVELPSGGLVNPFGAIARIPVTFYDFHSDRSNPEFEQPHCGGATLSKGMVANGLDGNRKPVLANEVELNAGISHWFKKWVPGEAGNTTVPKYTYKWGLRGGFMDGNEFSRCGADVRSTGTLVGHDTTFRDSVIPDTLPLRHIGNGMYLYNNDNFFRLDGKGFGNEWINDTNGQNPIGLHNFSYTMEIKTTFTKVPGQKFFFTGDDDVWVFINDHLVMDLGGIHLAATDSVIVDNLSLTDGNTYHFDFFYCERHSTSAHMRVMTNLLTYHQFTSKRIQWKRSYGNIN